MSRYKSKYVEDIKIELSSDKKLLYRIDLRKVNRCYRC
jgi:hypothetical protein